jgi:pyruvate carboxylase subunit B
METPNHPYADFVVTARKYKTLLTGKYINRPVWNKRQPGEVLSSLPGTVVQIAVTQGQAVAEGQLLIVLDAMKMLNRIPAPLSGTISEIYVQEGDKISKNHLIIKIDPR